MEQIYTNIKKAYIIYKDTTCYLPLHTTSVAAIAGMQISVNKYIRDQKYWL